MAKKSTMFTVHDSIVLEICFTVPVLGINNAGDMLAGLKKASDHNTKDIELDMNAVTSIDSTAIATLVKFFQYLSGSKRAVTLTNVAPDIMKILGMLKLSTFFKLKEKRESTS